MRLVGVIGDWSNGMIGVSKTFGGSSILSSPVFLWNGKSPESPCKIKVFRAFVVYNRSDERMKRINAGTNTYFVVLARQQSIY